MSREWEFKQMSNIKKRPYPALKDFPEFQNDSEKVTYATNINVNALEFASPDLKNNPEFMLSVIDIVMRYSLPLQN